MPLRELKQPLGCKGPLSSADAKQASAEAAMHKRIIARQLFYVHDIRMNCHQDITIIKQGLLCKMTAEKHHDAERSA
jgi:hypothetical protein